MEDGDVALLENTRFLPGDTKNDPELAAAWAALADLFVNDAFGAAHRAHASTSGLAEAVRARGGEAVAGLLLAKELRFLGDALAEPEHPFVAILGGAKISGKIEVIDALLPRVDRLLVGGAMANTFFKALGLETGASLVEDDRIEVARETLERAGDRLLLPVDCVVASDIAAGAATRVVERSAVRRATASRTSARPRSDDLRPGGGGCAHHRLERPHGGVRGGSVRRRDGGGGRGGSRRRVTAAPLRWSAEATPRPRRSEPASPIASPTFPRGAARRSSSSRATCCPAWQP